MLAAALANRISVVHDFQAGRFSDIIKRANDADDFVDGAAAFYGITQLVIVVLFIIWMFRAAKNNEALDRRDPRFGPGWSIGSWFIPLANLVIPVMILQDLWRGATLRPRAVIRLAERAGLVADRLSGGRPGSSRCCALALRVPPSRQRLARRHRGATRSRWSGSSRLAIAAVLAALVVWTLRGASSTPCAPSAPTYERRRAGAVARPRLTSDPHEAFHRLDRFVDLDVTAAIGRRRVADAVADVLVEQAEPHALQRLGDRHDCVSTSMQYSSSSIIRCRPRTCPSMRRSRLP